MSVTCVTIYYTKLVYFERIAMNYHNIFPGEFLERLNRFVALVKINGHIQEVHVKNTGRCKELLIPGSKIFLEKSNNPNRKTKYSIISIYKGQILVNMDSQVPNNVVYNGILDGKISGFESLKTLKKEKTYGHSRFDLYYETASQKGYIEVKGVTLEEDGIARFPDAPTSRGTKHVRELCEGQKEGFQNYIVFLIQMSPVHLFKPNDEKDPAFASMLRKAHKSGVKIICLTSTITENSIEILREIPYDLS